jgi:hypothetical protein
VVFDCKSEFFPPKIATENSFIKISQLRAMVVERKDIWYMDDGGLTYTICEDDSPLASAPLVEPCCACDEAKYEVIFEGLWSRHTHPKVHCKDKMSKN